MKIYTLDLSWEGAIVVIAKNEGEARAKMAEKSESYKYHVEEELQEHEITEDFFFENLGDR